MRINLPEQVKINNSLGCILAYSNCTMFGLRNVRGLACTHGTITLSLYCFSPISKDKIDRALAPTI